VRHYLIDQLRVVVGEIDVEPALAAVEAVGRRIAALHHRAARHQRAERGDELRVRGEAEGLRG
jgi:hypothetical protein